MDNARAVEAGEPTKGSIAKLTKVQREIMKWISQGWHAQQANGQAVHINGKRVCNVATMDSLTRAGLVVHEAQLRCWKATALGRTLKPE